MKQISTLITATLLLTILACTKKENSTVSPGAASAATRLKNISTSSMARMSGINYSQSISVDSANAMLISYLSSVGYPGVDTALRSLTFDADTLRAYLANPNIATVKFMIAHQPSYLHGFAGQNKGLNPQAITMIVIGLSEDDHYILNDRNQVYEHFMPCPNTCPGNSDALISLATQ